MTTSKFLRDTIQEALREYLGDGDGADELALLDYDRAIRAEAWDEGYEARSQDQYTEIIEYGTAFYDVTENPYRVTD